MSQKTRPKTYEQRLQVVRALVTLLSDPAADPAARAYEMTYFSAIRVAWVSARDRYLELGAQVDLASSAATQAFDQFTCATSRWYRSVTDSRGRPRTEELRRLNGGVLVSDILSASRPQAIRLAERMLKTLALCPALQGAPELFQDMRAAYGKLVETQTAFERARRDQVAQGQVLAQANHDFNVGYGHLVRTFRAMLGETETCRILPRFPSVSGKEADPSAAAPV